LVAQKVARRPGDRHSIITGIGSNYIDSVRAVIIPRLRSSRFSGYTPRENVTVTGSPKNIALLAAGRARCVDDEPLWGIGGIGLKWNRTM